MILLQILHEVIQSVFGIMQEEDYRFTLMMKKQQQTGTRLALQLSVTATD
jgi:hypothetical protein